MNFIKYEAAAEIYEEASQGDFKHPNLTYAKFIFADDKPNGNNQGIEYEDFPALAQSAIDMPIKIRFVSNTAGGHKGSVPIGHIKSINEVTLQDGSHQLVAEAVLYAEEYPEEVNFLKEAYASGTAPGISWELSYNSEVKKDGISWLKGLIAKAATFVKNPAYGSRTALLALASTTITDEELSRELTALASEISPTNSNKGGSNTMDEKEKQELLDKIKTLEAQLTEANGAKAKAETDLQTAQAEVQSKVEVIQKYERATLIDNRTKKVAEAGLTIEKDETKLAAKQEFWAALSEEAFTEYLSDLVAASKAAPKQAAASIRLAPDVPKIGAASSDGPVNVNDLRNRLRGLTRTPVTSATE